MIDVGLAGVAVRFVGTVGGMISGVVAFAVFEYPPSVLFVSLARTR